MTAILDYRRSYKNQYYFALHYITLLHSTCNKIEFRTVSYRVLLASCPKWCFAFKKSHEIATDNWEPVSLCRHICVYVFVLFNLLHRRSGRHRGMDVFLEEPFMACMSEDIRNDRQQLFMPT